MAPGISFYPQGLQRPESPLCSRLVTIPDIGYLAHWVDEVMYRPPAHFIAVKGDLVGFCGGIVLRRFQSKGSSAFSSRDGRCSGIFLGPWTPLDNSLVLDREGGRAQGVKKGVI